MSLTVTATPTQATGAPHIGPDNSGGDVVITAQPVEALVGHPAAAQFQAPPLAQGHIQCLPPVKTEIGLMLRPVSGGKTLDIEIPEKFLPELLGLYEKLIACCPDREKHPNARINYTRGWIEDDGQILAYLNEDPNSQSAKDLQALRQLHHKILNQSFSDIVWHDYKLHDRASDKDAPPFQKRTESEVLKRVKFTTDDVELAHLREYHTGRKLQKGIVDFLDKHIQTVSGSRPSLEKESRTGRLTRLKLTFEHLDEMVMGFHAAYPPPDLTGKSEQEQIDALQQYKQQANDYLQKAVKKNQADKNIVRKIHVPYFNQNDLDEPGLKDSIDEMAKEMALMACKTRAEYDYGCLALKTKPCKTTPEIFIMRLSALLANPNTTHYDISQFIDNQFPIAFDGLVHQEDSDAIYGHLDEVLIPRINKELSDARLTGAANAATYNRRLEQLDMVQKQKDLANEQRKIAADLRDKGPDFANLANAIEGLATEQDRLADGQQPPAAAAGQPVPPAPAAGGADAAHPAAGQVEAGLKGAANVAAYAPFVDQILGTERSVMGRDSTNALITRLEVQAKALETQIQALPEEQAKKKRELTQIVERLRRVIQRQTSFGQFIAEKVHPSHMPFHKNIELDAI